MAGQSEDIAAYEARLVAALSRIQAGIAKWPDGGAEAGDGSDPDPAQHELPVAMPSAGAADDEIATLRTQLDDERTANAQLQQRVRQIKRKQEERVRGLEAELEDINARYEAAAREAGKLRRASEGLRQALADMEAAAQAGAPDAHLINRAMMAELEALRAERSADAQEISEIITALEPLVEQETQDA